MSRENPEATVLFILIDFIPDPSCIFPLSDISDVYIVARELILISWIPFLKIEELILISWIPL
jgi:hypothetical protein